MVDEKSKGEKLKTVVSLLPKKNCGKCGFENCGRFAVAVVEEKTSPFGCHSNPPAGYQISRVLGIEVPENVNLPRGHSAKHKSKRGSSHVHSWDRSQFRHAAGHHGHKTGQSKTRSNHRQRGRRHVKRSGLNVRKMVAGFLRLVS
ncbi:MAG: (Fe-S)-binding protein [Dehalococcoidales bacterium]